MKKIDFVIYYIFMQLDSKHEKSKFYLTEKKILTEMFLIEKCLSQSSSQFTFIKLTLNSTGNYLEQVLRWYRVGS